MKIGIVSDLHSEFWTAHERRTIGGAVQAKLAAADLILLAGDIGVGVDSIKTANSLFPDKPVFMIAGNHEFYHSDYETVLGQLQDAPGNARFLHMTVAHIEIDDTLVRIIGTTLWTDFDLYGTPDLSLFDARQLNDFNLIRYRGRLLTPADTLAWHMEQRAWLLDRLDENYAGITILMTHHSPAAFGSHPRFHNDPLSPCFASRMANVLIRDDLPLVVWGHTHHCVDRTIANTRFISKQTGYPGRVIARAALTETGEIGEIIELATKQ